MDTRQTELVAQCDAHFRRNGLLPVTAEQAACLADPLRISEALEMVDDWEERLGLPAHLRGELADMICQREVAVDDEQQRADEALGERNAIVPPGADDRTEPRS